MAKLLLRAVRKRFEDQDRDAVCPMDLEVEDGELLVLVGPSGCGKTTTLRIIAGLEEATEGEVWIGGRMANGVAPKDRDVAFVFQSYALYPHMSAFDNMAFGLRMRGTPRDEVRRRVQRAAEMLGITELLERRPAQLSGGQRQRVAMGRAVVRQPQVFLFDEPLSNLDAKLRAQMRTEIKRLHHSLAATMIFVTHDQVEAMTLATRMVVMNAGRIEQIGAPAELYSRPATRFVAGFVGSPAMNFVPCLLKTNGAGLALEIEGGALLPVPPSLAPAYRAHAGRRLILGLRPEHLAEQFPGAAAQAVVSIEIEVLEPRGIETVAVGRVGSTELCVRLPASSSARRGSRLSLAAEMGQMHLIDPETDQVIR